jgi:glutamate-1-semialdehyde aminotransferase
VLEQELERFRYDHPRCAELHARARGSLFGGVPMPWMAMWAGGYPVAVAEAAGSRIVCADGVEFVDLCLGDTGAMAGHAPAPVLDVLRAPRGITTMLPTEDAA